jgi:hypothetical protein
LIASQTSLFILLGGVLYSIKINERLKIPRFAIAHTIRIYPTRAMAHMII